MVLSLVSQGRRNKNFISCVFHNGAWIKGNSNLGKAFEEHFRLLLGTLRLFKFLLDWQNMFSFKERIDLSDLEHPFSI